MTTEARGMAHALWLRAMPVVFVLLWSTGFVGAKYGLPYAGPLTFVALRIFLVILALGALVVLGRVAWPARRITLLHSAVAGLMLQASYLGGVFTAIAHGLPAGLVALIVGAQPLLTAGLAPWLLHERISWRQWVGFLAGLAGVVLVVWSRLAWTGNFATGMGLALFALLGITFGTIYQKRFCVGIDLRLNLLGQYASTFVVVLAGAAWTEDLHVTFSPVFIAALAWLVLVLSVGAVLLLMTLIRHGEAARVVSLFYLVPPVTAVIAAAAFGESLSAAVLGGMALTAVGVVLVNRG